MFQDKLEGRRTSASTSNPASSNFRVADEYERSTSRRTIHSLEYAWAAASRRACSIRSSTGAVRIQYAGEGFRVPHRPGRHAIQWWHRIIDAPAARVLPARLAAGFASTPTSSPCPRSRTATQPKMLVVDTKGRHLDNEHTSGRAARKRCSPRSRTLARQWHGAQRTSAGTRSIPCTARRKFTLVFDRRALRRGAGLRGLVGVPGFEPGTSSSRTKHSARLSYTPTRTNSIAPPRLPVAPALHWGGAAAPEVTP